ncbi:MAG TPA: SDR family oxidoreductase [Longimicrobiales bacterium]|nr:SDR family oxidoreductase [Longimicrobiales bacterium]
MRLAGKTIVVTGGSRGIGRACVVSAVAHGARVLFCSREDGAASRDVERAAGAGAAVGVRADVADEGSVIELFDQAMRRFGAVHGVVNNAAISRERLLVSTTTEDWEAVIDANLTGGFLVTREAIRLFIEQGQGGRVVSIGTLSQFGVSGNASYATSKGGLAGLTRRIAREYAHSGILSTMVIPGYVETAMSATMTDHAKRTLVEGAPLRRSGAPEEIASVVSFLLSDAAADLAGQAVFAAGGLHEVPP